MIHYTQKIDNENVLAILRRTCNLVDPRLIDHGVRVAWIVSKLLAQRGDAYSPTLQRDVCLLCALHDVGAYKTEEIDQLVQFETKSVWEHSIYGSLFLEYFFSPLRALAPVVLFHHAPFHALPALLPDPMCQELAALLHLADRADLLFGTQTEGMPALLARIDALSGTEFSPAAVALLHQAEITLPIAQQPNQDAAFSHMLRGVPFTMAEVDACMQMLICTIDFRSRHTVTHTMTTAAVSTALAQYAGLPPREVELVTCGALLHDLGKIGIPVEILEFPGKLSPQAMGVMKTHVALTADILGESVSPQVRDIALRHHEKLDGSGYPLGLTGEVLTPGERVVAVADIISALCGTRSYKDAFPKAQVVSILTEMGQAGLLDGPLVALAVTHFDAIMALVRQYTQPVLERYHAISQRYLTLLATYADTLDSP